jgi:hypothetical protein
MISDANLNRRRATAGRFAPRWEMPVAGSRSYRRRYSYVLRWDRAIDCDRRRIRNGTERLLRPLPHEVELYGQAEVERQFDIANIKPVLTLYGAASTSASICWTLPHGIVLCQGITPTKKGPLTR